MCCRPQRNCTLVDSLAAHVPELVQNSNESFSCTGTKERYSGKAYETKELVEKAKLDIVVFRYRTASDSSRL